jgi:hypothetical protein
MGAKDYDSTLFEPWQYLVIGQPQALARLFQGIGTEVVIGKEAVWP